MTDTSSALISWLKLSNQIEQGISSFRDIEQPEILINIFYSLFHVKSQVNEVQHRMRKMFRWLYKHIPKHLIDDPRLKQVRIDEFENCNVDAFEQTALLMFTCKMNDCDAFHKMLNLLDFSDRQTLETFTQSKKGDDENRNSRLPIKDIRLLADSIVEYKKVNNEYQTLTNELNRKLQNRDYKLKNEDRQISSYSVEMKEELKKINNSVHDLTSNIASRRNSLLSMTRRTRSEEDMTEDERKISMLIAKNENLKAKIAEAKKNTQELDELRSSALSVSEKSVELRKQYEEARKNVAIVQERIQKLRDDKNKKFKDLTDQINQLKSDKQNLTNTIKENLDALKAAKTHGDVFEKCKLLQETRSRRDQMLAELRILTNNVKTLQECYCT